MDSGVYSVCARGSTLHGSSSLLANSKVDRCRLDAKLPYLLPSSKPCGPRSLRTEGNHQLSSAR